MAYYLDTIDRQILYELDKNCRTTDAILAKRVKRSRETVRYRINKLVTDGVIQGFITSINPSKLGSIFLKLYFQLANNPTERKRFSAYIKNVPGVYWFGGNDGVWDLHAAFYGSNISELNKLKNKIFAEFRQLIIKRGIGVLVNVLQYPKQYLVPHNTERPPPVIFGGEISNYTLDLLERKILKLLSENARMSFIELSRRSHTSVDKVRTRMKNLEKAEVIIQYRISIDYTKIGYELFKAFIYFNNLSEQNEKQFLAYTADHPNIVYVIRQISAWDIELEIMAESYEIFTKIMDELRNRFSQVIRNYEFCAMREDIWDFKKIVDIKR